jgi:hypothetical protein
VNDAAKIPNKSVKKIAYVFKSLNMHNFDTITERDGGSDKGKSPLSENLMVEPAFHHCPSSLKVSKLHFVIF